MDRPEDFRRLLYEYGADGDGCGFLGAGSPRVRHFYLADESWDAEGRLPRVLCGIPLDGADATDLVDGLVTCKLCEIRRAALLSRGVWPVGSLAERFATILRAPGRTITVLDHTHLKIEADHDCAAAIRRAGALLRVTPGMIQGRDLIVTLYR
jgi:hypothetical protein